jgi:hypothetical protein
MPSIDQTPGPKYNPDLNHGYRRYGGSSLRKEKRFFEPRETPQLKANLPIQYTSIDGLSPSTIPESDRGSRLSAYVGGSTSKYRHANFGYGNRHDFTKSNQDDKGDFTINYDEMLTLKKSLDLRLQKGTRRGDTFGSSYCDKYIVPQGKQHYFGKGTERRNGISHKD